MREETCCHHMGYSFRLTAGVLLYAPSHREDCTYHSLCYTSRGALASARKSSTTILLKTNNWKEGRTCFSYKGWKERNVLFNNALSTFYLRLCSIGQIVKDYSESKIGNLLLPHGLFFLISSKGSFICTMEHIPWPLLHQSWSNG